MSTSEVLFEKDKVYDERRMSCVFALRVTKMAKKVQFGGRKQVWPYHKQ